MNIYSTPAQVRELITICLKLGIEAKTIRVQYSGGAWDTPATLPVQLPDDADPRFDIYSVSFTGDESAACNVAATLEQIKAMKMPALYRAWYVYIQITGKAISIDEFTAKLTEKILQPEIEAILGGK